MKSMIRRRRGAVAGMGRGKRNQDAMPGAGGERAAVGGGGWALGDCDASGGGKEGRGDGED